MNPVYTTGVLTGLSACVAIFFLPSVARQRLLHLSFAHLSQFMGFSVTVILLLNGPSEEKKKFHGEGEAVSNDCCDAITGKPRTLKR